MLSEVEFTEFFYMTDSFCKEFMFCLKNIEGCPLCFLEMPLKTFQHTKVNSLTFLYRREHGRNP